MKNLARFFVIGVIIYAGICAFFYWHQEKFIFFPQPVGLHPVRDDTEIIKFVTKDGTELGGLLIKNSIKKKTPLIIYFGGNAEEVLYNANDAHKYNGWSLALINYRGYGGSEGVPSEENLFSDALELYDYFSKRADIDSGKIVVVGRSLGSGVAIYVAEQRTVRGVIAITPYDSIDAVAKEKFPFLPVSILLKHRFDSISRAPHIKVPLLGLVAERDTIVPPHHAKRLTANWGGRVRTVIIPKADHNSINERSLYWTNIESFLSEL